jgi:hypothetical protein
MQVNRARICKRLWSPGIDSEDSIPPAYVAWRAAVRLIELSYRPARLGIDSWAPLSGIRALDGIWRPQADSQLTEDRCSQAMHAQSVLSPPPRDTTITTDFCSLLDIDKSFIFDRLYCTSGFGRATHPCAERIRLFRLINTQKMAPIAVSLFLFSENPWEIPEQGTHFHDEERKKPFSGQRKSSSISSGFFP